jgi:hypothetical protein
MRRGRGQLPSDAAFYYRVHWDGWALINQGAHEVSLVLRKKKLTGLIIDERG